MSKFVPLLDRGVIKVSGPDAAEFLQGLVTNNLDKTNQGGAVLSALLTPQGKIQYEFFIVPVAEDGYLLEMARGGLKELFGKLSLYKLRADVEIEDLSESHMVFWLDDLKQQSELEEFAKERRAESIFRDPRADELGLRAIVSVEKVAAFSEGLIPSHAEDYLMKRIKEGIPEGGLDYAFGDTFPHEAGYDLLDGVDFEKGCYVGQEVVSRMQHRSNVRKRIVSVTAEADLPEAGSEIRTENSMIGVLGSHVNGEGLALVRLDRAGKAVATGAPMLVEGVEVQLSVPEWAGYSLEPGEKA